MHDPAVVLRLVDDGLAQVLALEALLARGVAVLRSGRLVPPVDGDGVGDQVGGGQGADVLTPANKQLPGARLPLSFLLAL